MAINRTAIKKRWFYMIGKNAVVKVNSPMMVMIIKEHGFEVCTYLRYLNKRRELRDNEQIVDVSEGPLDLPAPSKGIPK